MFSPLLNTIYFNFVSFYHFFYFILSRSQHFILSWFILIFLSFLMYFHFYFILSDFPNFVCSVAFIPPLGSRKWAIRLSQSPAFAKCAVEQVILFYSSYWRLFFLFSLHFCSFSATLKFSFLFSYELFIYVLFYSMLPFYPTLLNSSHFISYSFYFYIS